MEYGKLAYIKAEELEARLAALGSVGDGRKAASAAFYPRLALETGYAPLSVAGRGSVSLTAVLRLTAPQGAENKKVWLYVGDKPAAYTRLTLSAGEQTERTLCAAVTPGAGETVRVVADGEGLILDELHVLTEGNGAYLTAAGSPYRSDCIGERVYLAQEKDGYVTVSICGESGSVTAGHGTAFDLAARGDTLGVLLGDDDGNLWGILYDGDLAERTRVFLGAGADRVALGRGVFGFTLAAVRNGKLYLSECGADFSGRTDWRAAEEVTATAEDVYLSKQSDTPALLFRRGGVLYCKLPAPYTGIAFAGVLSVTLTAGVN